MRFPALLLTSLTLAMGLTASAVPLVEYNFTGEVWDQTDPRYSDPSEVATGLAATRLVRSAYTDFVAHQVPSGGSATDRHLASWRWFPGGQYFEFSVTVDPGFILQLDSISFQATTNLPAGEFMALSVAYADNAAFSDPMTMGSFNIPNSGSYVNYSASNNPIVGGTGTYTFRIHNAAPSIASAISYGLYMDSLHLNGSLAAAPVPDGGSLALLTGAALVGLGLVRRHRARVAAGRS